MLSERQHISNKTAHRVLIVTPQISHCLQPRHIGVCLEYWIVFTNGIPRKLLGTIVGPLL